MSKLFLAANEALATKYLPAGGSDFGHLQLVFDAEDGEPPQEIEVQGGFPYWNYRGPRDHFNPDNTPGIDHPDKWKAYEFTSNDLDGRDPGQVWDMLLKVHKEFKNKGAYIEYDTVERPVQNSNSYIKTLLDVVGIDVAKYEAAVTPAGVVWGLPGIGRDVLEDSKTAVPLKLFGTRGDDIINTGAGADRVKGRGGDDEISTGLENDIVTGGPGNDTIDGGNGFDKARFLHDRKDYLIRELGDGRVSVEDRSEEGGDGVDILTSIEQLVFADQTLDVEMRMASDPAYLARTAVVGGGSRSPEKVADAPEPKPEASPKPEPGPQPEPPAADTVQDLGGNKPSEKKAEAPEPEPGPRPAPPAPETVQDLGGEKASGEDPGGDEKIDFANLPPPPDPPPLPPGPPPSLLGSEPEPGPEPESPVSDTVQDLGGNEPTGSNDEIFIA